MKSFARGHRTRMWRSWATVPNSAKPGSANPGPLSPLHLIVKPCQLPSIQGMARRGGRLNTQGLVEVLSGLGCPRREQHSCALGSSALDSPQPHAQPSPVGHLSPEQGEQLRAWGPPPTRRSQDREGEAYPGWKPPVAFLLGLAANPPAHVHQAP